MYNCELVGSKSNSYKLGMVVNEIKLTIRALNYPSRSVFEVTFSSVHYLRC